MVGVYYWPFRSPNPSKVGSTAQDLMAPRQARCFFFLGYYQLISMGALIILCNAVHLLCFFTGMSTAYEYAYTLHNDVLPAGLWRSASCIHTPHAYPMPCIHVHKCSACNF